MDIAKVQKSLATKASYQPQHRFNDLYRFVWHRDWLEAARRSILRNKGARTPGIDGIVPKDVTETEWQAMLDQLIVELKEDTYKPMPARREYVPKANGKLRPLGIATARDRVVQEVVKMVLEPIYESHFLDCSHGFRPLRSTMTAIKKVQYFHCEVRKYFWVVEGDIKACFDEIPHKKLVQVLRQVIKDERLLSLIWSFLKAGYMEDGILYVPDRGTPQGGIVSPLLANAYLHEMDKAWSERYGTLTPYQRRCRRREGLGNVQLVRYADDFLVLTNGSKEHACLLMEEFRVILAEMGLTLSSEKTHITHVDDGYDFLGFHVQRRPRLCNPQQRVLYITPTQRNVERYKEKIKTLLCSTRGDPVNKIRAVNRVVRGWANNYRHVQSSRVRKKLDYFTFRAMFKWLYRKHSGKVGWKELYNRYIFRNARGVKVLGYKTVHLARMTDVNFGRFYLPKGGIQNPYLSLEQFDDTITADEDLIADETWDGFSTQEGYSLIRQDLLAQCGPICHMCKREFPPRELDGHHVKALKHGGQNKQSNIVLLCRECHAKTRNYGSKTLEM